MFKLAIAILFSFLISLNAWANSCASAGAGLWSNSSNWSSCGGTVPGIGDTASITHAIEIAANVTVGTSPAEGTAVITVSGSGTVTVDAGVTVTVRGGVTLNASANTWTQAAGSGFIFDSSNATDPTNQQYEFRISTGHNDPARLILNGSSGSRVTFTSQSGGGNGWINDGSGPWLQGGLITATYVDFTNCGDSSNRCIRTSPSGAGNAVTIQHCRFDTTGGIGGTYNMSTTSDVSITDNYFTNTAASETIKFENASGYSSGTRDFLRNALDKVVQFYTPAGFTIEGNYFGSSIESTDGTWVSFQNNFARFTNSYNTLLIRGSAGPGRNYGFYDDNTNSNPHFFQIGYYDGGTIDGLTCESSYDGGTDNQGDCILAYQPGSSTTMTVQKTLVIPDAGGGPSGTIISMLGNANTTVALTRNTSVSNTTTQACFAFGETYTGHTSMVTALDSNICANLSSGTNNLAWDSGADDSVTDLFSSTAADYNCYYNISATRYYQFEFSSGTPGAHDTNANPTFTDATRSLRTWDASLGGAGTSANALAELALMNSATWDTNYTPEAVNTWVAAGFVPTSASLDGAGLAGVDCGAFDVVVASGFRGGMSLMGVGH